MKFLALFLALCLVIGAFANPDGDQDEKVERPLCPCPRNMDPVCASNMQTYPNRCLFNCAQRQMARSGRSMHLLRSGEC